MKADILHTLQQEILNLQGYKPSRKLASPTFGLGPVETAFPFQTFPTRVIHEFSSNNKEDAAATNGFIAALLSKLLTGTRKCVWITPDTDIYPPALLSFGIEPEQILFIEAHKTKDILWIIEESLKCETLLAVVGATEALNFTESRRLQLAVEQSHVTGFIHRVNANRQETIACAARWRIKPLPSINGNDLPGVGFPQWRVILDKVRNGKPGQWSLQWKAGHFYYQQKTKAVITPYQQLQTG